VESHRGYLERLVGGKEENGENPKKDLFRERREFFLHREVGNAIKERKKAQLIVAEKRGAFKEKKEKCFYIVFGQGRGEVLLFQGNIVKGID